VTAQITPLESTASGLFTGIEIVGETGYASYAANNNSAPFEIATWDHTTGALISSVPVVLDVPGEVFNVQGLDSLPDGTLLAYVWADIQDGEFWSTVYSVASIDPVTGVATLLVDITDLALENFYTDSLATDPTTGATFGFIDYNDGNPLVIRLNLEAGTYSGPVLLSGLANELGDGYVVGADFDTSGTLWFYYNAIDAARMIVSTSGDISAATESLTAAEVTQNADMQNLAYDPFVPQLANTGASVGAGVAALAAALLGAGAIALFSRRRRTA
jgi:LPXTG-motif cell wall-anchored protein